MPKIKLNYCHRPIRRNLIVPLTMTTNIKEKGKISVVGYVHRLILICSTISEISIQGNENENDKYSGILLFLEHHAL